MKAWSTLYKRSTEGKLEMWKIKVTKATCLVTMDYGEYDGAITSKSYQVKEGKNIGRSNETTPYEQACAEAQARWEKKLKEGYVTTIKAAQKGMVDKIIEGGLIPMLAKKYEDCKTKLKLPYMVQPKLDGQRCIITKIDGKLSMWTRTRKPIHSCPHILDEVAIMLGHIVNDFFLDGELYNHDLKHDFEKLMSAVRKDEPSQESREVQYHVYDGGYLNSPQPFKTRWKNIQDMMPSYLEHVITVPTFEADSHEFVDDLNHEFVRLGYEGTMVRGREGMYEHKRSGQLLKYKSFDDDEFRIIGVMKGEDLSVVMICVTKDGKSFRATMSGDKIKNQVYLIDHKLWQGKKLTVKYQGMTNTNGVPRFPVGVRIRHEE